MVSSAAFDSLTRVEPNLQTALTQHLKDPDPSVRRGALLTLSKADWSTDEAMSTLKLGLVDADADVRRTAIDALAVMGARAEDALPELIGILSADPSAAVRQSAANALARLGDAGERVLSRR